MTIPGKKALFRLNNKDGEPILDMLVSAGAAHAVQPLQKVLCRHAFDANKRCFVTPTTVTPLHRLVWSLGRQQAEFEHIDVVRSRLLAQLKVFRGDHLRRLNPTP